MSPLGGTVALATGEVSRVVPDAVDAWRTWTLRDDQRTRGPLLRPIGGHRRAWTPRRPTRATCPFHRSHRAPEAGCSCGLYAVRDAGLLRGARNPAVLGTVSLWGRIVEHELGFRGEIGYPQRLSLVCPFCFWQRGVGTATVDHVARTRRRRLVPVCDVHLTTATRSGYPVIELLDPAYVLGSLLATYAVDPIDRGLAAALTSPGRPVQPLLQGGEAMGTSETYRHRGSEVSEGGER